MVVIDSGVVKEALRKFRSSSRSLNFVLRQLAGLSLAYDLYLEVFWVPTWANPGHAASRNDPLESWRLKASVAARAVWGSRKILLIYVWIFLNFNVCMIAVGATQTV